MGLDVYVGSLTRYYCRRWETVVQQMARENGMEVTVARQDDSPPPNPEDVAPLASAWRDGLSAALSPHGVPPFTWDESLDAPYFTDKPAWDCYSALLVWASHLEHPDTPLPSVAPEDWSQYQPFVVSQQPGQTRFPHLLRDTELWLPVPLPFTFEADDLVGNKIAIGSVIGLKTELENLNHASWHADRNTLRTWRHEGAEVGCPLELSVRFAFAVFLALATDAAEHRLPMKLDY